MNQTFTTTAYTSESHWKPELHKAILRNFEYGCIIALILNPVFAIIDFSNLPDQWPLFLSIRIGVTILLALCYSHRYRFHSHPEWLNLIALTLLVTQDAFFYSKATTENIEQLTLAYLVDFIGASMVVIWRMFFSAGFMIYTVLINLIFFSLSDTMEFGAWLSGGGLLALSTLIFSMAVIQFRYYSTRSMIISSIELIRNNEFMTVQHDIIQKKSLQLQKSNSRLKEFAYIVSHDLKAPLRGIRNITSWMKEDCGSMLDDRGMEHLNLLEKQVVKMEYLIKAILDYSKSEGSGNGHEWINLDDLIKEVVDTVVVGEEVKITIRSEVPEMKGTRIVISQVLQNLINNSVKHNNSDKREVGISVNDSAGDILFSVRDNGPGIAQEDQARIFELFNSGGNQGSYENTGIGLPVAKKLVEKSGGRLWLESTPGRGSVFYFTLPRQQ